MWTVQSSGLPVAVQGLTLMTVALARMTMYCYTVPITIQDQRMISPPQSAASNDGAREEQPNSLSTVSRAIFLVSLPFGILHFVLPIFGQEVGTSGGALAVRVRGPAGALRRQRLDLGCVRAGIGCAAA
jgi:hypothetical protein